MDTQENASVRARCLTVGGAILLASSACSSNQEAIGADLREAVPFYVCNSLNAARSVGSKPQAGRDPRHDPPVVPVNPSAPLPDQIQIQLQATTTTTQQHQGQVGIGTPIVLNYQGQYQRQFADQHQVVIQYSSTDSIKKLVEQCNTVVPTPTPLQVLADSEGITAQTLQQSPPPPPPAPAPAPAPSAPPDPCAQFSIRVKPQYDGCLNQCQQDYDSAVGACRDDGCRGGVDNARHGCLAKCAGMKNASANAGCYSDR